MKITSLIMKTAVAGAILIGSSISAQAVEATATVQLNVRTGPGTSFGVIDTLDPGELVDTTECQSSGWCYIQQAGPNGWVSSSYLQAVPPAAPPGSGTPDCQLRLTLGSGSPRLELICGPTPGTPTPPPPAPPPVGNEACFYRDANYQGAHFCYAPGTLNSLNSTFNDRISSVKLFGTARAKLCVNNNLGGFCATISSNAPVLGALINNRGSSLKVYLPGVVSPVPIPLPIPLPLPIPIPQPIPDVYRTGSISIASSYTANIDNGVVGGNSSHTDLWHHAINAAVRRLEVQNGAKMALGDGSNRGYLGCKAASFSSNPVPFASLTVGTYVCVKTNVGRISQFRVNGYDGTTLKIGYTTFKLP
ncbi:MAG: SH3 domain-containing protein [Rhodobacteraceae bacterium]|nr:SH3 domain-containing protein [Paracoccaceae bacterium]